MSIAVSIVLTLLLIALISGILLGFFAEKFRADGNKLVEEINRLLPQTQCAQCGYPGCKPYAEAIARGEAINKCPPGGRQTISDLAQLLDQAYVPLDPDVGSEEIPRTALIREAECIGCTFCIQACPVDAIIGAAQQMHSVITAECTGCELCVAPCPVDCIDIIPLETKPQAEMLSKSLTQQECIRCGLCVDACPVDLLPQQLYWFIQGEAYEKAEQYKLTDCIECGLCHAVCPSHIPLVQYYQKGKAVLAEKRQQQQQADYTRQRFENRELRLAREKIQAEQRRQERARLADQRSSQDNMIQEALARARARQNQPGGHQ